MLNTHDHSTDPGMRLGDRMRLACRAGDAATARRLALEGDGRARDLAREYGLMVHGLGFTIRVLLDQLLESASAAGPAQAGAAIEAIEARLPAGEPLRAGDRPAAGAGLADLMSRLFGGLRKAVGDETPAPAAGLEPAQLGDACRVALDEAQRRCMLDQARRADEVVQALAGARLADVIAMLDAKDDSYLALHDPMVRFMADSFAWVLRHRGEQALVDFHLATAQAQRAGFEKWQQLPADEFAAMTAFLLRQHMGVVRVEEDAVRFTIRQSPCGSGGRLRLGNAYVGDGALPLVEVPGPLTFGEPRMPVYCTHCAIWNGSATLRWFGRAQWVFEQPARADGACTLHIYKRREDAPADYAARVALPAGEATL